MTGPRAWGWVVFAALLGAALHGLSHPPIGAPLVAPLAHALPLAVLCRVPRGEHARVLGLIFGTLAHAIPLRWLWAIFDVAAPALWLVFGLLYLAAFHLLFVLRERKGAAVMCLVAPVILVGLECFRSEWWFLRFPWATPGLSQIHDPLAAQSADVLGVYGLSFCAYGASAALAGLTLRPHRRASMAAATLMLSLPWVLGALAPWREEPEGAPLRVAVVQYETNDLDMARALAAGIGEDVELAVFPELGAALEHGRARDASLEALAGLARTARATVAIGVTRSHGGDFFNTLALVGEDGAGLAEYHKAEPVPLFADGIRAGPSDAVETPLGRLGLCICYDFTHPHVVHHALADAELAVVASGDLASWTELQHEEHRLIARMRAIEHRRWVVRATSSGFSQIVDPRGEEHVTLGYGEVSVAEGTVHRRHDRTLASRFGMVLPYGCLTATVLLALWAAVSGRLGARRLARANEA